MVVAGSAVLFLSHAGPFVVAAAGFGAVFSLGSLTRRNAIRLALVALVWTVVFAFVYWMQLSDVAAAEHLREGWQSEFVPKQSTRHASLWIVAAVGNIPNACLRVPELVSPAVALIAAVGLCALLRRQRGLAVALAATIVLPLVAAGLHLYPYSGRLLTFLAPSVAILVGAGFVSILGLLGAIIGDRSEPVDAGRNFGFSDGATMVPLIAALLIAAVAFLPERLWRRRVDFPRTMEHLALNVGQGDLVLVSPDLAWPLRYYGPVAATERDIEMQVFACTPDELVSEFRSEVAAGRRVWIVVPNMSRRYRGAQDKVRRRLLPAFAATDGRLLIEEFVNLSVINWTADVETRPLGSPEVEISSPIALGSTE
jgi:hypothetical protein